MKVLEVFDAAAMVVMFVGVVRVVGCIIERVLRDEGLFNTVFAGLVLVSAVWTVYRIEGRPYPEREDEEDG